MPLHPVAEEKKTRNLLHQAIVKQRRLLDILARIERLYAAVLNIDETNVSLARIFVKNDEYVTSVDVPNNACILSYATRAMAKYAPLSSEPPRPQHRFFCTYVFRDLRVVVIEVCCCCCSVRQ